MKAEGFEGRIAVVTGGGQGIGRAIVTALAGEGATVFAVARSQEKVELVAAEVEAAGGTAIGVPADVTDEAAVEALREVVLDRAGSVDLLVANAGIAGPTALLWEQDPAAWEEVFRVNVTGVFLCCRAFMPALIESRGSIVLIGSRTGKGPLFGRTPYAASKLALVGMLRTLAVEAGPHGVRVNLISPGAVAGERIDRVLRAQAEAREVSPREMGDWVAGQAPLKRLVRPQEIADAVVFLASERAASITGEDLNVAAGLNAF